MNVDDFEPFEVNKLIKQQKKKRKRRKKMGKKSKDKGHNYKRKIVEIFSEWSEEADVTDISDTYFPLSVGCKNTQSWSFDQIIKGTGEWFNYLVQVGSQAQEKENRLNEPSEPILIFTKDHSPDYICITTKLCDTFYLGELVDLILFIPGLSDEIIPGVVHVNEEGYAILLLSEFLTLVSYKNLLSELED